MNFLSRRFFTGLSCLKLPKNLSHSSGVLARLPKQELEGFLVKAQCDNKKIPNEIIKSLSVDKDAFSDTLCYSFLTEGKLLRPLLVSLVAATVNKHYFDEIDYNESSPGLYPTRELRSIITDYQYRISMISEMIHSSSLIHDDILDDAKTRRNRPSVWNKYNYVDAVLSGSYILTRSCELLAEIGDPDVTLTLSTVIEDLVRGELMQLTSLEDDDARFQLYLNKNYRKTASLMANSCKAVAMLCPTNVDQNVSESAFSFGKHLGMAFQLIDDVLDFVSSAEQLGKPSGGSDLMSGVFTAPVLFAAQHFEEVNTMISRKMCRSGDLKQTLDCVDKANGVGFTRMLAEFHFQEAQRNLRFLKDSPAKQALMHVAAKFLQREK